MDSLATWISLIIAATIAISNATSNLTESDECVNVITSYNASSCDPFLGVFWSDPSNWTELWQSWNDCDDLSKTDKSLCNGFRPVACDCVNYLNNSTDLDLTQYCSLDVLYQICTPTPSPTSLETTSTPVETVSSTASSIASSTAAPNAECSEENMNDKMEDKMAEINYKMIQKLDAGDCSVNPDDLEALLEALWKDSDIRECLILNDDYELYQNIEHCRKLLLTTTQPPTQQLATDSPTNSPSIPQTAEPTLTPIISPTTNPTINPITSPTTYPTLDPTVGPTASLDNATNNGTGNEPNGQSRNETNSETNDSANTDTDTNGQTNGNSTNETYDSSSYYGSGTYYSGSTYYDSSYGTEGNTSTGGFIPSPTDYPTLKPTNVEDVPNKTGFSGEGLGPDFNDSTDYYYSYDQTFYTPYRYNSTEAYVPDEGSTTQSLIIMGIIILGLCVLGIYCNRTRMKFETTEEDAKQGKKKKGGFEQIGEDSQSRLHKNQKSNDFYEDNTSDEEDEQNGKNKQNIDDTMVSQTVKLGKANKQLRASNKNSKKTRKSGKNNKKVKFSKVGSNENDEDMSDDSNELDGDDGMDPKNKNKRGKSFEDDEEEDYDSDGTGGVRVIPNPYAKNKKSKGFAGVLGEKFETFRESVNKNVSKLNSRKENVVVIPMNPLKSSKNDRNNAGSNDGNKKNKSKKKEYRDYGRVGSGIRRKKSKDSSSINSKDKKQMLSKKNSNDSDSGSSENDSNDSRNGKSKKNDVFKICEGDNVSDDYNITDSDGSSESSEDAIEVRINKVGRGIKQPMPLPQFYKPKGKGSGTSSTGKNAKGNTKTDGMNGTMEKRDKNENENEKSVTMGNGAGTKQNGLAPRPDKEHSSSRGGLLDNEARTPKNDGFSD